MRSSDSITTLAKALGKAKSSMEAPTKSRTNEHFKYNYADLAAVKSSYQKSLGENGLGIVHTLRPVEGHLVLTTTLLHESGEWIASDYPIQTIQTYSKPQEQGSALTYFKRYNVCALLDIVAEDDDDGAAAQASAPPKSKEEKAEARAENLDSLRKEINRYAMDAADISKKRPDEEIEAASAYERPSDKAIMPGIKKVAEITTAKHANYVLDNLRKRVLTLTGGEPPF